MTDWVDEVVKELAKETANYTKPESFSMWCNHVAPRFHQTGSTVFEQVEERMKTIQKIPYLDDMQKVQLLFVFSKPISFFYKMKLHRNGHKVEWDKSHRIMHFCSKSKKFMRHVEDRTMNFKGMPILASQHTQVQSPPNQDSFLPTVPNAPSSSTANNIWEFPFFGWNTFNEKMENFDYELNNGAPSPSQNFAGEQAVEYRMTADSGDQLLTAYAAQQCPDGDHEEDSVPVASDHEGSTSTKRRQEEQIVSAAKRSKPSRSQLIRRSISSSSDDDDDIIEVPHSVSFLNAPPTGISEIREVPRISALKLAEQIEMIAHFLNLHDLKTKASGIVRELQLEDKSICPKRFHREILSIWASVDDAKLKTYDGESMDVKKFLESLRLSVIRPLGRKVVADSLMYIEKKIKKVDEKKSQRVLPMEKIKENLESLLALATDN